MHTNTSIYIYIYTHIYVCVHTWAAAESGGSRRIENTPSPGDTDI